MRTFGFLSVGDLVAIAQHSSIKHAKISHIIESRQKEGLKPFRAFVIEGEGLKVSKFLVESDAHEYVATSDGSIKIYAI